MKAYLVRNTITGAILGVYRASCERGAVGAALYSDGIGGDSAPGVVADLGCPECGHDLEDNGLRGLELAVRCPACDLEVSNDG